MGTRCLCAEGLFAPTHLLAPPFNPAPESLCPRNLPVCRLGVNSLVGAAPVRSGRVGAAAQVRCVSLEVLYGRCAVHGAARCEGTLRLPRPVRYKGRARGVAHGSGEPASGGSRCTAAGAGWRSVCSSCCTAAVRTPVPPRTRRAQTQTSEQRADPKGMARALGCGRERRWHTAGKRCNNAAPSRRGVLAAGREGADIF